MKGRKLLITIFLGIPFTCILIGVMVTLFSDSDSASSTLTTSNEPAATPRPAPSFAEIADNEESMTDAQWEAYASKEVNGTRIEGWEGRVTQVDKGEITGDYTVYVVMPDRVLTDVFIEVNERTALALNKDQMIRFSGHLVHADNSLGLAIRVENATIELINN